MCESKSLNLTQFSTHHFLELYPCMCTEIIRLQSKTAHSNKRLCHADIQQQYLPGDTLPVVTVTHFTTNHKLLLKTNNFHLLCGRKSLFVYMKLYLKIYFQTYLKINFPFLYLFVTKSLIVDLLLFPAFCGTFPWLTLPAAQPQCTASCSRPKQVFNWIELFNNILHIVLILLHNILFW